MQYIRIPCKYIPPCRKCNSTKTGFYVRSSSSSAKANPLIIKMHLKKGELVEVVNNTIDNSISDKCICFDCGITWTEYFPTKWITINDLKKIKEEKGITDGLINYYKNFNTNYEKEMRKKKREEKKEKRKKKKEERKRRRKLW